MSTAARFYIGFVIGLGALGVLAELPRLTCADPLRFGFYFVVTLLCSTLKIVLPGIPGNVSVFNIMVMVGVVSLSAGETLAMGLSATLLQTYWHSRKPPRPGQVRPPQRTFC